jgi:toxin YhaV
LSLQSNIVINGWTLFAHPLFLDEINALTNQVEHLKSKDPINYVKKNATKRLAAITKLAFDVIPQDPTISEYRQGVTLGNDHKHWFRAKFFQQYRLFFRFDSTSKVIVFAWVNDEKKNALMAVKMMLTEYLKKCSTTDTLQTTGNNCWMKLRVIWTG